MSLFELQAELQQENQANSRALQQVIQSIDRAMTPNELTSLTLDAVRQAFGWDYGSYWVKNNKENALRFAVESGSVSEEFRRITETATFREGEGLSGRTWKQRSIYFVEDLGTMTDCVRAPAARRSGVKSGVCFPITIKGEVVGTMDFFATRTLTLSKQRLEALENVSQLVSSRLVQLQEVEAQKENLANTQAMQQVIQSIDRAMTPNELTSLTFQA